MKKNCRWKMEEKELKRADDMRAIVRHEEGYCGGKDICQYCQLDYLFIVAKELGYELVKKEKS